jgi:hypothetical protein
MATACTLSAGEALKATEQAIRLYCDMIDTDRAFLNGLTNIKLPVGFTRGSFDVKQAGKYGFKIPTLPMLSDLSCQLDWYYKDADQLEMHNRGKCQNDFFQDVWIYARRNLADSTKDIILIPNHVDNPDGGFSVMSFDLPAKGIDDKFTVDFSMTNSITCITAYIHLFDAATPIYTFTSGTPDTITRTSGSFVTDGVVAGQKVFIDNLGATGDNYRKIGTVAAGGVAALVLTLDEAGYLTTDAVGSADTVLRIGNEM